MSGEHHEKKPESEQITIRVKDQAGEETFFKVKRTTRMEKVFQTYAQRKGVDLNAIRFLYDGVRVNYDATPDELELEDHDQIDCMLYQSGGGRRSIYIRRCKDF